MSRARPAGDVELDHAILHSPTALEPDQIRTLSATLGQMVYRRVGQKDFT